MQGISTKESLLNDLGHLIDAIVSAVRHITPSLWHPYFLSNCCSVLRILSLALLVLGGAVGSMRRVLKFFKNTVPCMETTKDGFTFTRRAPNKQVVSCEKKAQKKGKTSASGGVDDEFVFNRVSRSQAKLNGKGRDDGERSGVAKKRRTIQMEQSIDLSTDISLLQGEPECNTALAKSSARDVLAKAGMPRTRSHEIHKRVLSSNVNDLIKECIHFLKDDSDYAREIIKHCNSNYFSDIDYRKEIEVTNTRSEHIKDEISKWDKAFLEEKASNAIAIPEITPYAEENRELGAEADRMLAEEFEEKARRLLELEERLKYFFENAKEKSDSLLKCIFGSLEEKSVDAIFLLKAMSKLGR